MTEIHFKKEVGNLTITLRHNPETEDVLGDKVELRTSDGYISMCVEEWRGLYEDEMKDLVEKAENTELPEEAEVVQ